MSFWTNDKTVLDEVGGGAEIPEGKHVGRIAEVKPKVTKAGHRALGLKLALTGGYKYWTDLNLENPNAADIARKNITIIMNSAYKDPPATIGTIDELAQALLGVPVNTTFKRREDYNGKPQYNVFFNQGVSEEERLSYAAKSKDY